MNKLRDRSLNILNENKVVILFVLLCIGAIYISKNPLTFVAGELFTRFGRNGFTVLALLIPVLAGMGLNFGITIGAIAAQIAVFWVVYWGFTGVEGFLLGLVMATPIAVLFGWLVGKLFNMMKGAEMIAGMVLGYFADGLYQLFFLYIIGGIIPVNNKTLIITGGIGVKNTIDLTGNLKYSLDTVSMMALIDIFFFITVAVVLLKFIIRAIKKTRTPIIKDLIFLGVATVIYLIGFIPVARDFLAADRLLLLDAVTISLIFLALFQVWRILRDKFIIRKDKVNIKNPIAIIITAGVLYGLTYIKSVETILLSVHIPVTTYLFIAGLCLFNNMLLRTRLGQNGSESILWTKL